MDREFPWVRYWRVQNAAENQRPQEEGVEGDESHFLYLPSTEYAELGLVAPTDLRVLPDLLKYPAVVLLGRPGAGKTTEIKLAYEEGLFNEGGCLTLYRRASSFGSQGAQAVMADVEKLEKESRAIRLVLDGADEWLMEDSRFLNALEELLEERRQRPSAPELRLVISCRAAEWPEGKLARLWPREQFIVARLCQLDAASASDFVKARLGTEADSFWQEVQRLKIQFLTVWPHSLASLVEEFESNDRKLPSTLFELVSRTARRRSDVHHSETDPERRKRLPEHDVSVDWMFRLASRAAALSCFSGWPKIGLQFGAQVPGIVAVEHLMAGEEPFPKEAIRTITQTDLEALPRTALFDLSDGGRTMTFSHQLMREFMAASWLAERSLPVTQLANLFGSYQMGGRWRHFPQLSAIAAWLASNPVSRGWRQFLVIHDPAVLLRADAAGLSVPEKLEIANALLACALQDRALDTSWQHRHLRGLACQGLAEIVRPYLQNFATEAEASRQLAIEFVRECQIDACAPDLWQAIQDPEVTLRPLMAYALFEIDKESDRWRDILDEVTPLDREGALLGAALSILVPTKLKVRDVLRHLIPKRNFGFMNGLYIDAINVMPKLIEDDDVIPIIQHSAQHHGQGFNESWKKDEESILGNAFHRLGKRLDEEDTMNVFVEWWWAAIVSQHHALDWDESPVKLGELGFEDPKRRHSVLKCAIKHPRLGYIQGGDSFWVYFDNFIRLPEDVAWLAQQLDLCPPRDAMIYARWLNTAFYRCRDIEGIRERLLSIYEKCSAVRETLPEPTDGRNILEQLDFQQKTLLKKDKERSENFLVKRKRWADEQEQAIKACTIRARSELASGNWRAWQSVENALFYQKHPGGGPVDLELVDELKCRSEPWMFETARLWLKHTPEVFPVQNQDRALDLQVSSTRALYALWDHLDDDSEVDQSVRRWWLPHIFACLFRFSWQSGNFTLQNCIQRFLPESAAALMAVVRADYTSSGDSWAVRELDLVAENVLQPLKQMLLEVPPKPYGFPSAMQWLARQDLAAAEEVASHWLGALGKGECGEAEIALMSAILLHLDGRLWPELKERLIHQRETAAKVFHHAFYRIGFDFDKNVDLSKWPSAYLAEVAELMIRTLPPNKDRYHDHNDEGTDDSTRHARDSLIKALGDRGMTEAIARLEALHIKGTERWFRQVHLRATREQHAALWTPLPPSELIKLAAEHDFQLVRSTEDLLRVTQSALETYQHDLLRSDALYGRHLRHENDGTPKHENALSDQLVEWLKRKLQILGLREVTNYHGKRTDILIQVQPRNREALSLVVEVKKDHSDLLLEKMETQLKELYLKREGRTHGIYLVFWFQDSVHKSQPAIRTLESIRDRLSEQAEALSDAHFCIESRVLDCRSETIQPSSPHGKRPKKPRAKKPK